MNKKPRNDIAGPTTMRRVEKMSGSKPSAVVLGPSISRKPTMMAAPAIAMSIKFFFTNGNS